MRTPFIAANWKMNTTVEQARQLVLSMKDRVDAVQGVEKSICPPFVSLIVLHEVLQGTSIKLGAQDVFHQENGAYTGEVSPLMLAGLCEYVILGHSERRQHFCETDELVNLKVKAALRTNLKPIVCVGESLDENEGGHTHEVLARQVREDLTGITDPNGLVVAYEPLWAIGTGRAATREQANATIGFIRAQLTDLFGHTMAQNIRILYGGSVTASNIADLLGMPEIDGALVGGASLRTDEFVSIVEQAARVKGL